MTPQEKLDQIDREIAALRETEAQQTAEIKSAKAKYRAETQPMRDARTETRSRISQAWGARSRAKFETLPAEEQEQIRAREHEMRKILDAMLLARPALPAFTNHDALLYRLEQGIQAIKPDGLSHHEGGIFWREAESQSTGEYKLEDDAT